MYLHIGQDFIVRDRDVIGIFDLDTTTSGHTNHITTDFLRHAEQNGAVVDVSDALPKSFLVTDFPDETVYVSPISSRTLKERAEKFGDF